MELNVTEKSHSYWIDCRSPQVYSMVRAFLFTISSKEWVNERGKKYQVYKETFAAKSSCGKFIGLLKPCYQNFLNDLKFKLGTDPVVKLTKEMPSAKSKVDFKIKDGVTYKDDEQREAGKFLEQPLPMHVLECATGFGKTFLGLYSSAMRGDRTMFLMQAKHIKTWLADIENFIDIDKKRVGIIRGRDSLIAAVTMKKENKYDADFIFVSSETFREYIKCHENGEDYCDITPGEFCEFFGIGRVVRDEAHEALHTLVRQTLFLNVNTLLCLSATIISEDKFQERMYEYTFPKVYRWKSKNNTHIEAYSVRYTQEYGLRIPYANGYGYNHGRYEKAILKKPYLRRQYADMIKNVVHNFELDYQKGQKMLLFCYLVDMCEFMAQEMKQMFPDLVVNTYTGKSKKTKKGKNGDDGDDILKSSDIIVTTIGSCGTGTNIVDLAHAYNTVAIGSKKQAWQTMGRLRPLKNYPGAYPKYFFFSNMTIPPHRKFEQTRRFDLIDKTRSISTMDIGCTMRKYR